MLGRRPDIEGLEGDPEGIGQQGRVVLGVLARRETGHRVGEDVAARPAEAIHRLRRDDESMRRVEPTGDPDDDLGLPDRAQALLQARDLDVVSLVAIEGEALLLVRDEREAIHRAQQADVRHRRTQREVDAPVCRALGIRATVVVESPLPHALLAHPVHVDVGDRTPGAGREALGLGKQGAHLIDHRLPVP